MAKHESTADETYIVGNVARMETDDHSIDEVTIVSDGRHYHYYDRDHQAETTATKGMVFRSLDIKSP